MSILDYGPDIWWQRSCRNPLTVPIRRGYDCLISVFHGLCLSDKCDSSLPTSTNVAFVPMCGPIFGGGVKDAS